jgi:nucleoid-associated protein YgaU
MKDLIKNFKLNENTVSMILGGLVVLFVGYLAINFLRGNGVNNNETITDVATSSSDLTSLPTTHIVEAGETLWSISEKYFKSGYNWVDIASANNLTDAGVIRTGMELTIPNVSARLANSTLSTEAAVATSTPTATIVPTQEPTMIASATPTATIEATPTATVAPVVADGSEKGMESGDMMSATNYVVVKGDSLWKVAEKVYGDGARWMEIAKANSLVNPRVIHSGNNLVIPR